MADEILLRPLSAADELSAVTLLQQGFRDEPTYRWCLLADEEPGYGERLYQLMLADHGFNKQHSHIQGAYLNGQLVGVLYLQPSNSIELSEQHNWDNVQKECGEACVERVNLYVNNVAAVKLADNACKVALVAVDQAFRGKGIGRLLLQWVDEAIAIDPAIKGVQLETSSLDNVRLYERAGYQVIKTLLFANCTQYLMLKPYP